MSQIPLKRKVGVGSFFDVSIPEAGTYQLIDGGSTIALSLGDGEEPVYVVRYKQEPAIEDLKGFLGRQLDDFYCNGIRSACPEAALPVIEQIERESLLAAHLVVAIPGEMCWLARVSSKAGAKFHVLMHTYGSQAHLELSVTVLDSLVLK